MRQRIPFNSESSAVLKVIWFISSKLKIAEYSQTHREVLPIVFTVKIFYYISVW